MLPDKKIQVDFNAPDLSSNGGLVLVGLMKESIAQKVARLIPDHRNQLFVQHSSNNGPSSDIQNMALRVIAHSTTPPMNNVG